MVIHYTTPMRIESIEPFAVCRDPAQCPPGLIEIAFTGRSNVGKSSLLNALAGREIARVSRTPGKTRLIHVYRINRRYGWVDLPGYGYARVPREAREEWAPLIESYLSRPEVRALLFLVDTRHPPGRLDRSMADWLRERGYQAILVGTKVDRVPFGRRQAVERLLRGGLRWPTGEPLVLTSARTGEGIAALRRMIGRLLTDR